jgi:hypothetical protein
VLCDLHLTEPSSVQQPEKFALIRVTKHIRALWLVKQCRDSNLGNSIAFSDHRVIGELLQRTTVRPFSTKSSPNLGGSRRARFAIGISRWLYRYSEQDRH